MIFVFGSNLAGIHGAGAAKYAAQFYGAESYVGKGPTGFCYAIPTKDEKIKTLRLSEIDFYVHEFMKYADKHRDMNFLVTKIGTGLAGYKNEEIAPMFKGVPYNCFMPSEWSGMY